jgi:phosphoserine phosphatase
MTHSFSGNARYSHTDFISYMQQHAFHTYTFKTQLWSGTQGPTCAMPVVTVVTDNPNAHIIESIVTALSQEVTCQQIYVHGLSEHLAATAICIAVNELPNHVLVTQLSDQFHVEIFAQQEQPKLTQPGVLVMDMDSTVIQIECIDEIAKLCGKGEEVSAVTELAMQGKLDFAESLLQRVQCLAGIDIKNLEQIRDSIPLMPGIHTLLHHLKENDWTLAIASGGFTYFAEYLQARLGLDMVVANELGQANGVLTGTINGSISDAQTKADTLNRLVAERQIPAGQTIALGDGANDLVMMAHANLGMAYHAKPLVQEKATAAIRFGGLENTLFALQG